MPSTGGFRGIEVTVPLCKPLKSEVMLPQIIQMAEAGSSIFLISQALGVGRGLVRDALHLHQTGHRRPRPSDQPFVPKYQQIAAEVDRRRHAGESFDRLTREMKISRSTILRAYEFANRDETAVAAREGRKPTRPPYRWSEQSRAARRKPQT